MIDRRSVTRASLASTLLFAIAAACTSPGATQPAPTSTDAMMDHSASPTDAMMDHSASPSDHMMEESPSPS